MTANFTADQKQYLEGFATGLALAKATKAKSAPGASEPQGPDAPHIAAQNRVIEAGGKLADQEKWKREEHPFDAYGRLKDQAARNEFPKPADNFRWRYYGLFYVAQVEAAPGRTPDRMSVSISLASQSEMGRVSFRTVLPDQGACGSPCRRPVLLAHRCP